MSSIRRTLLLSTTGTISLFLAFAGVFLYGSIRDRLIDRFDTSLEHKFYLIEALTEFREMLDPSLETDIQKEATYIVEEFVNVRQDIDYTTRTFMQVWDETGKELYRSPTLGEQSLETRHGPLLSDMDTRWVQLPDGKPGRVHEEHILIEPVIEHEGESVFRYYTDEPAIDAGAVRLSIALDATDLVADISFLRNTLIGVVSATIVLLCLVLWWTIRRALRPAITLANQIESLDEHELDDRLSTRLPAELQPIAKRFNGFLDRLRDAFVREREFTDDAAHELRTPLAVLQLKLDLALSRDRSTETLRETCSDCRDVVGDLQDKVNCILMISRYQAGHHPLQLEAVDVNGVVRKAWESIPGRLVKTVHIDWELGDDCQITSNPQLTALIASNLIDNAATYVNLGGRITICTERRGDSILLSVSNTGSQLTQQQAEQAIGRFWRLDKSRTEEGSHSGLGLAFIAKAVELLSGHLDIRSDPGAAFVATVTLPCRFTESDEARPIAGDASA